MMNQFTPADSRKLTEALSSLYATVLLAGRKRRSRYTRTRRIPREAPATCQNVEQMELGLAMADNSDR
ncbi:MAG: hypothetical protein R3F19_29275 [Verrucomicrobiales bacterium]